MPIPPAIRDTTPEAESTEEEIKLRFIALNYGQEIADDVRVYLGNKR